MVWLKGIFGRYLDVDLSKGAIRDYKIPSEWYYKYLGGRGIALRILLKELKGDEDPLGPENILIFATGPLQGTRIAGAGRHAIVSKSPKTGCLNECYSGGFWAQELGTSGYDGIIVRGEASAPTYLSLLDGNIEIHDAEPLWGLEVGECDRVLRDKNKKARVLCIGPAGENLVKFACIINDVTRACARPGFGAVMGSKKLKAIIVKGNQEKPLHDSDMFSEISKKLTKELISTQKVREFGKDGTPPYYKTMNDAGALPTKNFQEGHFDGVEKGLNTLNQILVKRDNCTGCPIACKQLVKGEYKGRVIEERYGCPEFESLGALGSCCLNDDMLGVVYANQLCNRYGLDTISAGVTVAFAMEASEKGLIDEKISWGDPEAVIDLLEDITFKKGIGKRLADGIDTVAQEIKADFAMHIKGVEIPMHDPRGKIALGLSYATTPRGGNHMESMQDDAAEELGKYVNPEIGIYGPIDRFSWDRKPRYLKINTDLASFTNSAITCAFVGFDITLPKGYNAYPRWREALYAATGLEIGVSEMLLIGERNFNLLKLSAAEQGYRRTDDGLPERLLGPLPRGGSSGRPIPNEMLQENIDEYYKLRGWDSYGPTDQKLTQLDMEEFKGFIKRR